MKIASTVMIGIPGYSRAGSQSVTVALSVAVIAAISLCCLQPAAAAETRAQALKRIHTRVVDIDSNYGGQGYPKKPELKQMAEELNVLLKDKGDEAEALFLRGMIEANIEEMNNSLKDLSEAIKLNPKNGKAYWQRGIDYAMMGRAAEAKLDFDAAVANGETSSMVYMNLGSVEMALDKDNEAIIDLTRAIDKPDPRSPLWPSLMVRAHCYQKTKKFDLAQKDAEAVLATQDAPPPVVADAQRTVAEALLLQKKFQEAIPVLTRAAESQKGADKAKLIYMRGYCYHNTGQEDKANADVAEARNLGFQPKGAPPPDRPLRMTIDNDVKIQPYIDQARKTLPFTKDRFNKGMKPGYTLNVTTRIFDDENHFEQVFVLVKAWKDDTISGDLNSQVKLKGHKEGEPITVLEKDVLDWTIVDPDGREEGNFVGRYLDSLQK